MIATLTHVTILNILCHQNFSSSGRGKETTFLTQVSLLLPMIPIVPLPYYSQKHLLTTRLVRDNLAQVGWESGVPADYISPTD